MRYNSETLRHAEGDPNLRWARQLALSDYAERIAGLGCWEWTPETDELLLSDNLFRLFGYEPNEIVPSPALLLARVHPDDRGRVRELLDVLLLADGIADRGLEYRIVRIDGMVCTLCVTVAIALAGGPGEPRRIIGSVRDVSVERRLDRQLAAHAAVTRALDDWTSLHRGADELLAGFASAFELPFGTFWVPIGSRLEAAAIWHVPSTALRSVAEVTRNWQPGRGSATVGRAFTGRRPVIFSSALTGSPSRRTAAIRAAGLQGALVVPAVAGDETLAVCEFLLAEAPEPTEKLLRVLGGLGHEIGHFLSHRRGEMVAPALTPRELAVLQLAARARSAAAIAAELHVSPATVKRHFERAYAALGVSDRAGAVGEAMRRGLIS